MLDIRFGHDEGVMLMLVYKSLVSSLKEEGKKKKINTNTKSQVFFVFCFFARMRMGVDI